MTGDPTSTQAIVLTNKHLLSAIFSSVFVGFFADKYNKLMLLIVVILISIGSVLLLLFSPTMFHPMAYISMVAFGFATGGFLTLMAQILSRYPDPRFRASVGAVGSVFTTMGGAFSSILGLYLMQFDVRIPYFMYLGLSSFGILILLLLYITNRKVFSQK